MGECFAQDCQAEKGSRPTHSNCGGELQINSDAYLRCTKCGKEEHVQDWVWRHDKACHELTMKSNEEEGPNSGLVIQIAGALTEKLGRAWLMKYLVV